MLGEAEERAFLRELANGDQPVPAACQRPTRSALSGLRGFGRLALRDILEVARLVFQARNALRRQPIADIITELASLRSSSSSGVAADCPASAAAIRFSRARRFVPIGGNCLSDSLALARWLANYGQSAALVFGVKLDPFAAHCWVQSGEILLNDDPGRIERFTPVRIVQCTRATP